MNNTVYVFGNLGGNYTQYPNDYTKEIFRVFQNNVTAESQLIIHRDNNLMYYGYVRKLDVSPQYIGLCILLNGIMFLEPKNLFPIFENAVADMVVKGRILQFDENGKIFSQLVYLNGRQNEIKRIATIIGNEISALKVDKLPPLNYGIDHTSQKRLSFNDKNDEITEASYQYGYTIIPKPTNSNTDDLNGVQDVIKRLNKKQLEYKQQYQEERQKNLKLQAQQKNFIWVGMLLVIVAIMGAVLYFKVLNPSEVTHYETDEFVYYGPMKDKKPHGVGVAIYPENDRFGRKYYIGNFVNGLRQDSSAMLFYQDGDYYYGSMTDDQWEKGIIYMNSDNSHFTGTFQQNIPYTGTWYDHQIAHRLQNGEIEE